MPLSPQIKKVLQGETGELINYDYFDIAEGTGIKNFYGAQAEASGAITKYFLTTDNTIFSNKVAEKVKSVGDGVHRVVSDVNYDVMFNLPKQIKGQSRCSITQSLKNVSGTGNVGIQLYLYKYDGSTSTLMASGATILTTSAIGETKTDTRNIPLDLSSQLWKFRRGDILRLNVKLIEAGGAATAYMAYGCDPQDRDDVTDASGAIIITAGYTTQLKLQVPFLLDL